MQSIRQRVPTVRQQSLESGQKARLAQTQTWRKCNRWQKPLHQKRWKLLNQHVVGNLTANEQLQSSGSPRTQPLRRPERHSATRRRKVALIKHPKQFAAGRLKEPPPPPPTSRALVRQTPAAHHRRQSEGHLVSCGAAAAAQHHPARMLRPRPSTFSAAPQWHR